MSDTEDDLRSTADSIAATAERLAAIEEEKEGLGADDPRMIELSTESRQLAGELVPKTSAELELAKEARKA